MTTCNKKRQIQDYENKDRFYVGYFYYRENLNWAAQNFRLGLWIGHSCSSHNNVFQSP